MTIRSIIVWSNVSDATFAAAYNDEHVPLIRALPQLLGLRVSPLVAKSGGLVAELFFDDLEEMRAAYGSPAGAQLIAHANEFESRYGATVSRFVAREPQIDEKV